MDQSLKKRVMVVDDDLLFLSAIKRNLELGGIEVLIFSDSRLAVDKIPEESPIDLLILDLTMPEFDGAEFIEFLAMTSFTTPIIIVSGWWSETLNLCAALGRAHGLNIVGVHEKPFDIAHVYEYLQHEQTSRFSARKLG